MRIKFLLSFAVALFFPVFLLAQVVVYENKDTLKITEETLTPDGKIVTTTVFEKQSVFTNGFWYNWELTAGIGPHLYYGDNDWKVAKKWEMITFPVIDIDLTKWISPSFGIGFGVSTGRFKGLYQSAVKFWGDGSLGANFQTDRPYTKADPKYDYQKLAYQKAWFTDVYGVFHVDWASVLKGYKPDRFFTVDSYIGGGLIMAYDKGNRDKLIPGAAANIGFINKFRLSDDVKLAIDVRGALVGDDFDGELYVQEPTKPHWDQNNRMDGNFGITVGLTFNIGRDHSKWRTASRTSQSIYEPDAIAAVPADKYDHDVMVEGLNDNAVKRDTVLVSNVPEVWFHINFIVDRWDLLTRELVNLNAVADLIKSTPDVRYLICGYADKQTATPEHNMMLSENRSKAVYNALIEMFGVNPKQLVRDYKGGVDYMFYNEKELSRCVMITAIHE